MSRCGAASTTTALESLDQRTATNVTTSTDLLINLVAWDGLRSVLPSAVLMSWSRSGWVLLFPITCAAAILVLAGCLWAKRLERVRSVRFREQLAERTRTARDLQDRLLQTIEASRMIADDALDPPADPVRMRRTMSRISDWLGQATVEGQAALDSLRATASEESDLAATSSSLYLQKLWRRLWFARKSAPDRP
jgi:signal transduction histidine kinase